MTGVEARKRKLEDLLARVERNRKAIEAVRARGPLVAVEPSAPRPVLPVPREPEPAPAPAPTPAVIALEPRPLGIAEPVVAPRPETVEPPETRAFEGRFAPGTVVTVREAVVRTWTLAAVLERARNLGGV